MTKLIVAFRDFANAPKKTVVIFKVLFRYSPEDTDTRMKTSDRLPGVRTGLETTTSQMQSLGYYRCQQAVGSTRLHTPLVWTVFGSCKLVHNRQVSFRHLNETDHLLWDTYFPRDRWGTLSPHYLWKTAEDGFLECQRGNPSRITQKLLCIKAGASAKLGFQTFNSI